MVASIEELVVWQKARDLNKSLYKILENKNFYQNHGLVDQLQRASVSVVLNIAEGFHSGSNKSFYNFLRYSYRSLGEVKSIITISMDLNYISSKEYEYICGKIIETRKVLSGLMKYLRNKIGSTKN